MKKINTVGGGAQTNENGLHFEQETELIDIFSNHPKYEVQNGYEIHLKSSGKLVATLYQKHSLYKRLLEPQGIDYRDFISKKLLPDDAILIHKTSTLYIIEKKFQSSAGSVDEKLQTCDFKRKEYNRLFNPIGINVEYCYFLCDWFKRPEYKDVRDYIHSMGCQYFFDSIPLTYLML